MYEVDPGLPNLKASDLAAVTRPLHEATNLPGVLYVDPVVWQLEKEEIFGRMWVCVGREESIPGRGDWFATSVADQVLLVVRGNDERVRAFYNVCRHRGACLVHEPGGKGAKAFRCEYHAWAYGCDGALVAAPLMTEREGFDAADWPLRSVRLDTWNGFLFANLDADATPLADSLGDFPDIAHYRLAEMRGAHRVVYDLAANWKLVCENYSECYHCALVHPQLNRVSDYRSGGNRLAGACYNGGPMTLNEGMETMSMSGRGRLPVIAGLGGDDLRRVQYFHIYPHLLLSLDPQYAVVHRLEPVAPGHTRIVCDWLVPAASLEAAPGGWADAVEFWDVTNRQDWALCEMVQRAAGSAGTRPGPYHPAETLVHEFDSWYVHRMGPRLPARAE